VEHRLPEATLGLGPPAGSRGCALASLLCSVGGKGPAIARDLPSAVSRRRVENLAWHGFLRRGRVAGPADRASSAVIRGGLASAKKARQAGLFMDGARIRT